MIFANEHYSATIHTNARERLAVPSFDAEALPRGVPSFDAEALPRGVHLSQYDMHARNSGGRGFPTIRAAARYRDGSFFFEITVEKLSHSGFLLMGIGSSTIIHNNQHRAIDRIGSSTIIHNNQYLPSEKYNSYGLSSSGELMAIGEVVSGGHQYYGEGDKVGLICNLDKRVVTFYVNSHQVGEVLHHAGLEGGIRNLTPFMEYAPFVVFGNGTFEVTINRVPEIGKIFNVKEKTALESNASRQEHFVHPDYIKDD
ncbi:hypothetical protein T484DRAFT_1785502 [Baffinella frigidus]|nr:hypothetical protein T484DRAFT_1785502 [Cryptophyta sp. CCMP2293]